jgi:hypothetical protein
VSEENAEALGAGAGSPIVERLAEAVGLHAAEVIAAPEGSEEPGPGVYADLGKLPAATVVSEDGLAALFGKAHRDSVKRAVERGELPPPLKVMGKNCWTVGYLVRFFEERLEAEARKIARLRPGV